MVCECFLNVLLCLQDSTRFLFISFLSVFEHGGPGSDDVGSWSASSDACGGVDATVPFSVDVQLVLSEFLGSEHQDGATLWSIGVLVWIA